jgi:predicted permease
VIDQFIKLSRRLLFYLRRGRFDRELEEELRFHLELKIEQNIKNGMSGEQARYAALREFGNVTLVKEESHAMWAFRSVEALQQDLRYGMRILAKRPVFTAVAVLSLTLGIGVNTAVFSLINAVLLRPLPVKNPNQLVELFTSSSSGDPYSRSSYQDFLDWRNNNQVFSGLIAYSHLPVNLGIDSRAERINGVIVTANYFSVLGVEPYSGRFFLPEEDSQAGNAAVAVISYSLWKDRFGDDQSIVGKSVMLNGANYTVVGIAPKGFRGTTLDYTPQVWIPVMMQAQATASADRLSRRNSRWLMVMGRLKSDSGLEQAQAEMNVVANQLEQAYPRSNQKRFITVKLANEVAIRPTVKGDLVSFLRLMLAVAGFVLLITCVNLANLLLAHGSVRWKEIAIRRALGAGRIRIIRQLLTESLLLSLTGGVLGLVVARWSADIFSKFNLQSAQNIAISELDLTIDGRVFGFTLAVAILTGLAFGLVPALQNSKTSIVESLKDETPIKGFHKFGLSKLLVVSQLALALVLLSGTILFLKNLMNLQAVDPGFNSHNAFLMSFDVGLQGYNPAQGGIFYQELLTRVSSLTGVRSASLAKVVPVSPNRNRLGVAVPGLAIQPEEYDYNIVAPYYFQTMGMPLLQGRDFTQQDGPSSRKAVIINEVMAERLWPGENPIGKRLIIPASPNPEAEVVGLVKNGKYLSMAGDPEPYIYLSVLQEYDPSMTLVVSTMGDAKPVILAAKQQITDLDKSLPVYAVQTLDEHLGEILSREKMAASLMTAFGVLALLLVAVGAYGLFNYTVKQRTREIGIRMALGASPGQIFLLVMRQGFLLAVIGTGIGLAGAVALAKIIPLKLYEVSLIDLQSFIGASILIFAVALTAIFLPARKAMRLDPMVALRYE